MLRFNLTIFEQDQSWNAAHSELAGYLGMFVNIDLDDFDFASVFAGDLIKYRRRC